MTTTPPPPPTKHDHPDVHTMIWTQSELVWIQNRDAQWQAYATQARADLEAENKRLREALSEAADDIESWGAYADAYFQKKHDLEGCVAKARAALEKHP